MELKSYVWKLWDALKVAQDGRMFFVREFSHSFHMTSRQMRVLVQISIEEKSTLLVLANELNMNPGNLSRLLVELEGRDMIVRVRDRFDQRKVWISLSKKGEHLIRYFDENLISSISGFLSSLDDDQLVSMLRNLQILGEHIQDEKSKYQEKKGIQGRRSQREDEDMEEDSNF